MDVSTVHICFCKRRT